MIIPSRFVIRANPIQRGTRSPKTSPKTNQIAGGSVQEPGAYASQVSRKTHKSGLISREIVFAALSHTHARRIHHGQIIEIRPEQTEKL